MNYPKDLPDMDLKKKSPHINHATYIVTMAALFAITLTMISINKASAPSLSVNFSELQKADQSSASQGDLVTRTFQSENLRGSSNPLILNNNSLLVFNIVPPKEGSVVSDIYIRFLSDKEYPSMPFKISFHNPRNTIQEIIFEDSSSWTSKQSIQTPSLKSIIDTSKNRVEVLIKKQGNIQPRGVSQAELVIIYQE